MTNNYFIHIWCLLSSFFFLTQRNHIPSSSLWYCFVDTETLPTYSWIIHVLPLTVKQFWVRNQVRTCGVIDCMHVLMKISTWMFLSYALQMMSRMDRNRSAFHDLLYRKRHIGTQLIWKITTIGCWRFDTVDFEVTVNIKTDAHVLSSCWRVQSYLKLKSNISVDAHILKMVLSANCSF